ncbi:MAG: FAD-dependent oxidoreductase [Candidatus Eremiobacteraeota bacterium]|nr:FAD-dependent oxidoreductase [Candidatus Eremiobacteraeota bacterium]
MVTQEAQDVDLIVIGSGQGGVPLAVDAAKAGKHVVLFERGRIGGSCVNYGCTPSKAFLAAAHNAGRARNAAPLGVHADVRIDGPAVMERVRSVRDEWHDGSEKRVARSGIDLVRASASFTGERVVAGGGRTVRAPLVVIDTGTSPQIPPIAGLADVPYFTNLTWFEQAAPPGRLVVIGGGYVGLELGQGARRLGSEVTIVHGASRLMEREEPDATDVLRSSLEADGVRLELDARATSVTSSGDAIAVTLSNGRTLESDALLLATGRTPNTPDLAVARSGIELDARGFVRCDDYLQSTCPGVYAVGDVAGQPAFTHVSWEDYRRLTSTFAGRPRRRDDRVLSYTTFTEPQLARAGLTEADARSRGIDARSQTLQLADVARGAEWNLETGFMRLVIDASTAKIVGATFVGYEMGELVHTIGFAIELGATWQKLDEFVAIHPTFGEGLPSLARMFA